MEIVLVIALITAIILAYNYFGKKPSAYNSEISKQYIDQSSGDSKRVRKSNKTWGKFGVAGHNHLPDDVKWIVWKELKVGDELKLLPDPSNRYDKNAIKVFFHGHLIGWFPKDHDRKIEVFNALISGKLVKVTCTSNDRRQDYIRATRRDDNGNWNDKYFMTQYVEAKFEYTIQ